MSQSLLLQLARDSIQEVLEAQNSIDRDTLLKQYPVLHEKISSYVTLWLDQEVRACAGRFFAQNSLLEDIIHNAKIAAFQDPDATPLSTSEYLHCKLELSLLTPPELLQFSSLESLYDQIEAGRHGLALQEGEQLRVFLPYRWQHYPDKKSFVHALIASMPRSRSQKFYRFECESAISPAIIKEKENNV